MTKWTVACSCLAAASDARLAGNEPLVVSPVLVTAPLFNYEERAGDARRGRPGHLGQSRQSPPVADHRHGKGCRPARLRPVRRAAAGAVATQRPADPARGSGDPGRREPVARQSLRGQRRAARRSAASTTSTSSTTCDWAPHRHDPRVDVAVGVRSRLRSRAVLQDRSVGAERAAGGHHGPQACRACFPMRYEQPSPLQPSGAVEGWRYNPVDDQNTVYGLTAVQGENQVFVTQRERGLVRQLQIVPAPGGRLTYTSKRTFLFRTSFELPDESGRRRTPGRRAARPRSRSRSPEGWSWTRRTTRCTSRSRPSAFTGFRSALLCPTW